MAFSAKSKFSKEVLQKSPLDVDFKEWLDITTNTDPSNKKEAEKHIREVYKQSSLKPPKRFIWLNSPLQGTIAACMLRRVDHCVVSKIAGSTGFEPDGKDWRKIQDITILINTIRREIAEDLTIEYIERRSKTLHCDLYELVKKNLILYDKIHEFKNKKILNSHNFDSIAELAYGGTYETIRRLYGSQQIGSNVNTYKFSLRSPLTKCISKETGWWWPYEKYCVVTEKPTAFLLDPERRLHNEKDMALQYADGWGMYAINGVVVPEQIITAPDTITTTQIAFERNSEIRRVMRQQYGYAKYFQDIGATVLDDDAEWGKLWRADVDFEGEPLCYVEVINSTPEPDGSYKNYFLRVPPDINSAHDAIAWTFTDDEGESLTSQTYKPEVQT